MNKQTFLTQLHKGLSSLSKAEREEQLAFYSEMIDDRMEEGLTEEEAVRGIGSVEIVLAQILGDTPPTAKNATSKSPSQRVWNTVLLVLGAPVWLSLLVAAFAVVISLYAALWSVVISLWAVFGSLVGCALAGILLGMVFVCGSQKLTGVALFSVGILCAGLSIFLFWGSKAATVGTVQLPKYIIRNCFPKRRIRNG